MVMAILVGTSSTGSITVVGGVGWSGSLPVGANDANKQGTYVINFLNKYNTLLFADVQIHSSLPNYVAFISGSVSGSSNTAPTLFSSSANGNAAIVFQTFITGSNSASAMPSGSTPYFFTFEALWRNSSTKP